MVDANRHGKVSQKEWNDFYVAFVTQFENSDSEPRDGVLDEKEVEKSISDIPGFLNLLKNSKR